MPLMTSNDPHLKWPDPRATRRCRTRRPSSCRPCAACRPVSRHAAPPQTRPHLSAGRSHRHDRAPPGTEKNHLGTHVRTAEDVADEATALGHPQTKRHRRGSSSYGPLSPSTQTAGASQYNMCSEQCGCHHRILGTERLKTGSGHRVSEAREQGWFDLYDWS
eukprot:732074-Pyramimonas_sp.AAC.1